MQRIAPHARNDRDAILVRAMVVVCCKQPGGDDGARYLTTAMMWCTSIRSEVNIDPPTGSPRYRSLSSDSRNPRIPDRRNRGANCSSTNKIRRHRSFGCTVIVIVVLLQTPSFGWWMMLRLPTSNFSQTVVSYELLFRMLLFFGALCGCPRSFGAVVVENRSFFACSLLSLRWCCGVGTNEERTDSESSSPSVLPVHG